MGIPTQNVPKLGPRQQFASSQYPSCQQPGRRVAAARAVLVGNLLVGHDAKVLEKQFDPGDPRPRGADVPALTAEGPALRGKAVIGGEDHRAATNDGRLAFGVS
jgi:hypothetical protein